MSFKEGISKEKQDLMANKRPYETAAFIIFSVLFIQQIGLLIYRLIDYFKDKKASTINLAFFNVGNTTCPTFFARIIGLDNSNFSFILLAFAALGLWYFLIYLLVWNYCKRRGYAKWTWTTLIIFGPTILFMPPYIIYAVYVFRPYFFRFLKTIVEEYKVYDPSIPFKEEIVDEKEEVVEVEKEEVINETKSEKYE
jgi:uncharacterized membrane protein